VFCQKQHFVSPFGVPTKSILIVDGEPELSVEIQKQLQRAGFRVVLAQDCESAQDLAEQARFDLFIVELNLIEDRKGRSPNRMPNVKARTKLLKKWRQRYPHSRPVAQSPPLSNRPASS
jgi:DNA-binding NtrC family response regulator